MPPRKNIRIGRYGRMRARYLKEHKNLEYKKLTDKVSEIMENYPNILALIEDNEVNSLNEEECKILQKLIKHYKINMEGVKK